MKKICAVVIGIALAAPAAADWRLSHVLHKDQKKIDRTVFPATDTQLEIWYTTERAALASETSTAVFDIAGNRLFMIDRVNRRFVVTALPIDPAKAFEKAAIKTIQTRTTTVTATASGETRKIGAWSCSRHDLVLTVVVTGKSFGKTHTFTTRTSLAMWMTQEIPADPAVHQRAIAGLWQLLLFDQATVAELAKVPGYPVLVESRSECLIKDGKPEWVETSRVELTGAAQADAPTEVFAIPEGYTRREIFDPRELGFRWVSF